MEERWAALHQEISSVSSKLLSCTDPSEKALLQSMLDELKSRRPYLEFSQLDRDYHDLIEVDSKISRKRAGQADVSEELDALLLRRVSLKSRIEKLSGTLGAGGKDFEAKLDGIMGRLEERLSATRVASKISEEDFVHVLQQLKILIASTPGDENETAVLRKHPTKFW